jgi:hypothetical protein
MTLTSNGEVVEESASGCLGKRCSINVENVEVSLIKRGFDETRVIVSESLLIFKGHEFLRQSRHCIRYKVNRSRQLISGGDSSSACHTAEVLLTLVSLEVDSVHQELRSWNILNRPVFPVLKSVAGRGDVLGLLASCWRKSG